MATVASAPAEPAMQPIALMRCAADGCMIRPEPRSWDDATLGRMPGAFTAPKDFQVYILSYGPAGWARVLVNHPDEGAVEGWVETRSLTTSVPVYGPSGAAAQSEASVSSTSSTASTPTSTGRVVNGSSDAMARHQEFMQKRGGQGRAAPPPPPRRRAKR